MSNDNETLDTPQKRNEAVARAVAHRTAAAKLNGFIAPTTHDTMNNISEYLDGLADLLIRRGDGLASVIVTMKAALDYEIEQPTYLWGTRVRAVPPPGKQLFGGPPEPLVSKSAPESQRKRRKEGK